MLTKRRHRHQKCGRCKRSLALDKFAPSKRGKSGKWCRSCFKELWLSKRQDSKEGTSARRGTKSRLWKVWLSHRSAQKGRTDYPAVVFSCNRCQRVVRPIFRKSYITIYRSVVMGLICPRCNNGGLADIDARHDAA